MLSVLDLVLEDPGSKPSSAMMLPGWGWATVPLWIRSFKAAVLLERKHSLALMAGNIRHISPHHNMEFGPLGKKCGGESKGCTTWSSDATASCDMTTSGFGGGQQSWLHNAAATSCSFYSSFLADSCSVLGWRSAEVCCGLAKAESRPGSCCLVALKWCHEVMPRAGVPTCCTLDMPLNKCIAFKLTPEKCRMSGKIYLLLLV